MQGLFGFFCCLTYKRRRQWLLIGAFGTTVFLGDFFLLSLFSSSDHFASGNASSGDVSENVGNMNKSAFIPISMKHKG